MSALEARIRRLAREEIEAGGSTTATADGPDRVAELEKEVADLRARLEKLENVPRRAATARKGTGE
ncbi:hypothetical protein [Streptomyces luteogriseus]|uniref:hypothetical protein n=1 Tax=Streptomyces luteogriseus TaxID=68233 RepID=UPI00382F3DD8